MGYRKKRIFFSISFRFLLIVLAIPLCLCYVSVFVDPEVLPVFGVFGVYFLPIVLLNLIFLIIALVRRSLSAWIPIISLVPALFFADFFVQYGNERKDPKDGFTLLTYNVGRFVASKEEKTLEEVQRDISAFLEKEDPDIVTLQEFRISDTAAIAGLYPQYPFRQKFLLRYGNGRYFAGNLTLSKYPILSGDKISFRGSTNMAIYSDIRVRDSVLRIYNIHLESNSVSMTSLIKKIKGNYEDFSSEFVEAHEKVRNSASRRTRQVKYIIEHIGKSPYRPLICGDLNDTPMSFCFRKLHQGRKDSFQEGGSGFGATYSVLWPLLRIDYVLVPESCPVGSHRTPRIGCSDHYPVITTIGFNYDRQEQGN